MTTNPYAPPVLSVEPVPVKRPFFKSGSRILFAAFVGRFVFTTGPYILWLFSDPATTMQYFDALRISSIRWYIVIPCLTRGISAIFMSFILIGVGILGRALRSSKRLLWLCWGVTLVAAIHVILNWAQLIDWYLFASRTSAEPTQLLFALSSITKTPVLLGLMWLIRQLAKNRQSIRTYRLATATFLLILAGFGRSFFVEHPLPIKSGANQWFLDNSLALGLTILEQLTLIATLWSARKLEDFPPEVPLIVKPIKPKRRSGRAARAENV